MITDSKIERELKEVRAAYGSYLKGKRVAIIGPAPSILNSKQAEELDKFDVIVRLNKALPVPTELRPDIGSRTDVLYNCMNPSPECGGIIDIDLLHRERVKYLIAPYAPYKDHRYKGDVYAFAKRNLQHKTPVNFCHISPTYFARLMEIIKLPNTGVNAILDILQHDIKELYITGLTFFKGGYIKQYRGYSESQVLARMAKYNLHDQDRQLHYMKKILAFNPRVKMDKALTDIIYAIEPVTFKIDRSILKSTVPVATKEKTVAAAKGKAEKSKATATATATKGKDKGKGKDAVKSKNLIKKKIKISKGKISTLK
jgi:hypothetical protein